MRKLRAFAAAALSLYLLPVSSQTPESILDSLSGGRRPEKIFTHFDRSFYQPGETIWFKAYSIVDGRPGSSSSVARAELIDPKGKIIASRILPLVIGTASGSIELPGNLPQGPYVFRLFTQQMLSGGPQTFYYKAIPVVASGADMVASPGQDVVVEFIAESGTFLADELNVLVMKATDETGRPANTSGSIKDGGGTVIASFATEVNGMGKVELTPKKGEHYWAEYSLPSGAKKTVELPAVANEGTNLLVVDEVLKKRIIVNTRASLNPKNKAAYIIGEMDQVLIFKIDISNSGGRYMGRVPVTELPGGLLHVAVFNSEHEVLAERTCFVNSKREIVEPLLAAELPSAKKRSENKFAFALPDSLEGTLSMTVADLAHEGNWLQQENIITSMLFGSSVGSGHINPFYELQPIPGLEKNEHIDMLLITHGYRWDWKTLTKLASTPAAEQEDYIQLTGIALADRNNKPPLVDAELAFLVQTKDSVFNSFVTKTDAAGRFSVDGLFFEDTATIYVRNNAEKNRDKRVHIQEAGSPLLEKFNYPVDLSLIRAAIPVFYTQRIKPVRITTAQPAIDFDTTVKVLEELVVVSKAKSKTELVENQYTRGLFASGARASIDLVTYPPANQTGNVFDYLKGRYSYMQVVGNFPNFGLIYRATRSLASGYIPMNLYLDEFPADATMISTIPLRDIALIRVYSAGIMGNGGALAVYTKKDSDSKSNRLLENMTSLKLPGFSKTEAFYSPDYNSKTINIKRDSRKTLYWAPAVTYLPEDGKLPFRFFTNDSGKGYKIILQGISIDGKLLYVEKTVK